MPSKPLREGRICSASFDGTIGLHQLGEVEDATTEKTVTSGDCHGVGTLLRSTSLSRDAS
jgi:hypothetical protein